MKKRLHRSIWQRAGTCKEIRGKAKVELKIKTGEGGRTFGSVSSKEIAIAVKEQLGYDLDKEKDPDQKKQSVHLECILYRSNFTRK